MDRLEYLLIYSQCELLRSAVAGTKAGEMTHVNESHPSITFVHIADE